MGGIRETNAGDSVYGHFGAVKFPHDPHVAALRVAEEFRVSLISFAQLQHVNVTCGIALHFAPQTLIQLSEVTADTPEGPMTQKWFDTESAHIDALHRMEKLVHELPGTNIIMSESFLKRLEDPPKNVQQLGKVSLKGQDSPLSLFLLPSDLVKKKELEAFKEKHFKAPSKKAA